MKLHKWKKMKQLGKQTLAIALIVIMLAGIAQQSKASNFGTEVTEENEINLLTSPKFGFSEEIYDSVVLQAEQQGELAAFSLSFQVKANEIQAEEDPLPNETQEESSSQGQTTEEEVESTQENTLPSEIPMSTMESQTSESPPPETTFSSENLLPPQTSSTADILPEVVEVELPTYNTVVVAENEIMEEIIFSLPFSDFYVIRQGMTTGEIVLESDNPSENGKPTGTFRIEKDGENILVKGGISLPKNRKQAWRGNLTFNLGFTTKVSKLAILLDEEKGIVSGKDIAEKVAFKRTPMEGKLRAVTTPKETIPILPGESKTIQIDIKAALENSKNVDYQKFAILYKSATMVLTTTRGSQKINVKLDATLDETYLGDGFEKILDDFNGDDLSAYLENKDTYNSLLNLELPFQFGDTFTTMDGHDTTVGLTVGGDKENDVFGYYKLENSVTTPGLLKLLCALDKKLYGKTDVTLGFEYDLLCTKEIAADEVYDLKEADGKITCGTDNLKVAVAGDPTVEEGYTLDKTVLESQKEDPCVTYKINLKSYEVGGINGGVLEDILPLAGSAGNEYPVLAVTGVFLTTDKGIRTEITEGNGKEGTYSVMDGKKLQITFPEHHDDTSKMITRAMLEVETMLTAPAMMEMNRDKTITFGNQAHFTKKGEIIPTKEASAPPVTKEYSVLDKKGKQNQQNASQMDWSIHLDTAFTEKPNIYLIDTLDPAVHDYVEGSAFQLKIKKSNGTTETQTLTLQKSNQAGTEYSKVTTEMLDTYRQALGGDSIKAFYYEETSGRHVMVIAISDFLSSGSKNPQRERVDIQYTTQIAQGTPSGSKQIKNSADIRWQYAGGNGPGWKPEFSFGLERDSVIELGAVSKRPAAYEESSQKQKWIFDVNAVRQDVGMVVIKEDFSADGSTQILPDTIELNVEKIHSKSLGNPITEGTIKSGTGGDPFPYYVLSNGNKCIEIFLGNVTKEDNFTVALTTKVSGALTSKPNPLGSDSNHKIENTASISCDGGNTYPSTIKASCVVPNTLIQKEAIKYGTGNDAYSYNYVTDEMQWKVLANPNALSIEKAMITDTLPQYLTFKNLTEVSYGGDAITAGSGSLITLPTIGNTEISTQSITIDGVTAYLQMKNSTDTTGTRESYEVTLVTAKDGAALTLKKPLILNFTTGITQTYRDSIFAAKKPDLTYTNIALDGKLNTSFKNEVVLTGEIKDSSSTTSYPVVAGASAVHDVAIKVLEKSATYDSKRPGIIKWTAVINQGKGEIGGKILKDTLSPDLPLEFNTDATSYALYKGVVEEDGTITNGALVSDPTIQIVGKELNIVFPTNVKETYLLQFETYITDDANLADLKNTLQLVDASGEGLASNTAGLADGGKFSMNDYATAKDTPILMLEKVSSNKGTSNLNELKLENVEFKIVEQTYDTIAGIWKDSTSTENKIKATKKNGKQLFVNFKVNTLYRIEEARPLDGYQRCEDIYICWLNTGATDPTAGKPIPSGSKLEVVDAKKSRLKKLMVENTPFATAAGGGIEFKKVNEKKQPISNVEFTLQRVDGKVAQKTVKSDAEGKVLFEYVDPGDYILIEKSVENPYQKPVKTMTITKHATDFTMLGDGVTGDFASGYQIVNQLAKTNLNITKIDAMVQTQKLQHAEFILTGTDYLGNPVTLPKVGEANTTGANGILTIKNIPVAQDGSYYILEETSYPIGYRDNITEPKKYKVFVTAQDNQAKIKVTDFKDETSILTQSQDVTIKNNPNVGTITFFKEGTTRKKADGTGNSPKALEGAKFGLFASASSTVPVNNKNGNQAIATSKADGSVEFTDIYFGNYVIKEITAPVGYQKSNATVLVTRADMQSNATFREDVVTGDTNFSYPMKAAQTASLRNELVQIPLKLKKTDQNGTALANVEFSIERWGSSSVVDTTGLTGYVSYAVDKPANSSIQDTVKTDGTGIADVGTLLFGTYKITEKNVGTTVITNPDPIYVTVDLVNDVVKVTQYTQDPIANTGAAGTEISLQANSYLIPIVNQIKYGALQIKKVVGKKTAANSYEALEQGGMVLPLSDAVFEIYHKSQVTTNGAGQLILNGSQTPYLTLQTDVNGQFVYETTASSADYGTYLDVDGRTKKYLLVGDYYLREKTPPTGYVLNEQFYPFTMGWDKNLSTPVTVSNCEKDGKKYFVNEADKATVSFRKVYYVQDATEQYTYGIENAEFSLYKDQACTQLYQKAESERGTATKESGTVVFQDVEPGIYYMKETKTPNLFEDASRIIYKVVTNGKKTTPIITLLNDTNELTEIANKPLQTLLDTTLELTLKGSNGSPIENAEFEIYRDGVLFMRAKTNSQGKLRRASVLPGMYTIRQLSSKDGFLPNTLPEQIKVKEGEQALVSVVNQKKQDSQTSEKKGDNGAKSASTPVISYKKQVSANVVETKTPSIKELPKTGGMGMEVLGLLVGLALIVLGFAEIKKKRADKEDLE